MIIHAIMKIGQYWNMGRVRIQYPERIPEIRNHTLIPVDSPRIKQYKRAEKVKMKSVSVNTTPLSEIDVKDIADKIPAR